MKFDTIKFQLMKEKVFFFFLLNLFISILCMHVLFLGICLILFMFSHVVMDTSISLIGVNNFSGQNQLYWHEQNTSLGSWGCAAIMFYFLFYLTKSWSLPLRRVAEHRLQRLPEYCCCVFARLPVQPLIFPCRPAPTRRLTVPSPLLTRKMLPTSDLKC